MAAPATDVNQPTQLVAEANDLIQQAESWEIVDQPSYEEATRIAIRCNSKAKAIEEHYEVPIRQADQAHKAVLASRNSLTKPLITARDILSRKQIDWERIQREAAAEQARIARAEAERLQMIETEKRIEAMEHEGASAAAVVQALAELKSMPVFAPPAPKSFTPVAGAVTRKSYVAVVENPIHFFRAAVDRADLKGIFYDNAILKALTAKLTSLAKANNGHLEVAGVVIHETGTKAYTRDTSL